MKIERSEAEEIIINLKERLGVKTDKELADKLELARSTITAWKTRNSVPERYRKILTGDLWHTMHQAPITWGEVENAALEIATLEFIFKNKNLFGDYRSYLKSGGMAFARVWEYQSDAAERIVELVNSGEETSVHRAKDYIIYDRYFSNKDGLNDL